jgi:peptidoglycan/xylan/chitin deacetylase (PgdA/CDA1 family)
MVQRLKLLVLWLSRALGLFELARMRTRNGLRILCYHGFTLRDESDFRPGLFIREETFRRRMEYLSRRKYPVLTLDDAHRRLSAGTLPAAAVVITIDDGFYSVARIACPILKSLSLPSTLYVTSYYLGKPEPVFRLAVQYLFWRSTRRHLDTAGLGLPTTRMFRLDSSRHDHDGMWEIIRYGETCLDEAGRTLLATRLGERLEVSYPSLAQSRALGLMRADEVRTLAASGMDVQLHTHRHHLPEDRELTLREIDQNRLVLEPIVGAPLKHFCYPSGIWSRAHWPWLAERQVATATTCDPGLNYRGTPSLGLTRFLDSEEMAQLEFEAEVSGFSEIVRRARAWVQSLRWIRQRAVVDHA